MAIIKRDGLFHGDRLRACSDEAQLYWTRFLIAANTLGRLELNYQSFCSEGPLASLREKPRPQQVGEWFKEYHKNHLGFVYQADGRLWVQWWSDPDTYGYEKKADRTTPAPPAEAYDKWQTEYLERKKASTIDLNDFQVVFTTSKDKPGEFSEDSVEFLKISKDLKTLENPSENFLGIGSGSGNGSGKGSGNKPGARKTGGPAKPLDSIPVRLPPDERFKLCIDAVDKYWHFKNDPLPFIWDESEGKELKRLLQATPRLTLEQFKTCLNHRARSEVVHTDRPRLWLKNLMSFAAAPIDRYGKPQGENGNGQQQVSAAQARQQRTRSAIANAFGVGDRQDAGPSQFDNPARSDRAGGIVLEGDLGRAPPGDD